MGAPCVCGVEALKIDADEEAGRRCRHRHRHQRGRHDLASTAPPGIVVLGRRRAGASRAHRRSWTPSWSGPTSSAPWACAPTPTTPRTRSCPATSAPRASACAAPSTCSWAIASRSSRRFILNEDEPTVREKAVDDLLEAQTGDFYGMFKAMDGLPVIVRLLDPPLHEFLESPRELDVEIATPGGRRRATAADIAEKRALMEQIDAMAEAEPHARPARLPPGHRVSRSFPRCRCAPSPLPLPSLKKEGLDPQARDHDPARVRASRAGQACAR